MNPRTLFVLLVSFTLFSYQCKKSEIERTPKRAKTQLPYHLSKKVNQELKKGQQGAIQNSLNLGIKKGLSYKTYSQFKSLNLLHLFTPSGLHYFPIFWILRFIFSFKVLRVYSIIFWFLCLSLDGFYSLKRIAAIKMIWLWKKYFPFKVDLFQIVIFVFFIDFILGSFTYSPLSWGYSFLFLGLLSSAGSSSMIAKIGLGQLFVSLFEKGSFNFFNFLSGYGISIFTSFCFPYLFVSYWTPWRDLPFVSNITEIIVYLVDVLSSTGSKAPTLNPIILFLLIFIKRNKFKLGIATFLF